MASMAASFTPPPPGAPSPHALARITVILMKTIAVFNNKGGIGKTTFSVHLALYASARRIRTLAVGLDRQGDFCRWLSKGEQQLSDGHTHKVNDHLRVLYSPMALPKQRWEVDLVVADCPPAVETVDAVDADLWLVPLDGRLAIENLGNIHQSLCQAGGQILLVLNRCDLIGKRALEGLRQAARGIPRATVRPEPIPTAPAIAKAAEYQRTVWTVPHGGDTKAARAMETLCEEVLASCGVRGKN